MREVRDIVLLELARYKNKSTLAVLTHSTCGQQQKAPDTGAFCCCPPSRARTYDRLLKRELLYQLSYGRIGK
jgi:hypothetical protein